jgi:hypothetical protein
VAFGADKFWYYYPAIMVDESKNLVMVFNRSGLNEYAGIRYTGRLDSDAPGTLRPSMQLKAGESNYEILGLGDTRNRWGDYNGIALDPADNTTIWMYSEYAEAPVNSASRWGTWIGQTTFTPLAGSQISLDPQEIYFGRVQLDSASADVPITIHSIGDQSLTVTAISDPGGNFVLKNLPALPAVIPPAGSIELTVSFAPTAVPLPAKVTLSPASAGFDSATIVISSNDADDPVAAVFLTGIAVPAGVVRAGGLYAVSGAADGGRFFTIDGGNGGATLTGATGFAALSALAINSLGEVYATTPASPSTLIKINAITGVGAAVGEMNAGAVDALAFDGNDVLYAASRAKNSALYKIDVSTAQATLIDSTGVDCISGLAFSRAGVLYASTSKECSGAGDRIYTINRTTAAATLVGATGFNSSIPGIAFDWDGNFFGITGAEGSNPNALIAINPATGAGAAVGPLGFAAMSDMSIAPGDPTAIENEEPAVASTFALEQNYPNPFNPSTRIRYALSNPAQVTLKIYSLLGQHVRTLVDQKQDRNFYEVAWDGRNDNGMAMPSGVYFYQIRAGNEVATRRMLFLK